MYNGISAGAAAKGLDLRFIDPVDVTNRADMGIGGCIRLKAPLPAANESTMAVVTDEAATRVCNRLQNTIYCFGRRTDDDPILVDCPSLKHLYIRLAM